jgi:uncharacterized repeat protein (TIGR01451 family)
MFRGLIDQVEIYGSALSLAEIQNVQNTAVQSADLSVTKAIDGASTLEPGGTVIYNITVTNNGPTDTTGVTVTDSLPSGLTYSSSTPSQGTYTSGTGAWNVGNLNNGVTATLTINATVNAGVNGTITNTASITASGLSDPDTSNNSASVDFTLSPSLIVVKTVSTTSDPTGSTNPKAIPGAEMLYTVQVTNQGAGAVDTDTIVITCPIPANTKLYVGDLATPPPGGPVIFLDGPDFGNPASNLTYTYVLLNDGTDDVSFSNNGGSDYLYSPTVDGDGCDSAVTHMRVNPKGSMNGAAGGNNPSFQVRFRVRVE